MSKKEYGKIRRGFSSLLSQCEKSSALIANCKSCAYFYTSNESEEEYCHNTGVSEYDMCRREDGTEFCCYWKSMGMRAKEKAKE